MERGPTGDHPTAPASGLMFTCPVRQDAVHPGGTAEAALDEVRTAKGRAYRWPF
ncbi:hypothetical protein [Streptomyces sp. NBC_01304]|uniref:hypothetical protein n=1 Tax=Streptomyces sp. NBC_01304 TaxID=2903818 RepID=UPI002E118E5B|nr:hypothetical protein OG430_04495 [Streptomyces sp. NBC_01304]